MEYLRPSIELHYCSELFSLQTVIAVLFNHDDAPLLKQRLPGCVLTTVGTDMEDLPSVPRSRIMLPLPGRVFALARITRGNLYVLGFVQQNNDDSNSFLRNEQIPVSLSRFEEEFKKIQPYMNSDRANEPSYHWLIKDPLAYYH